MFDDILDFMPEIPIAEWTTDFTDFLTSTFSFLFTPIKEHFGNFMEYTSDLLIKVPPIIIIIVVALIFFFITGKRVGLDRKSTRLNSSHVAISYAVFCLKKKKNDRIK